MYKGYKCPGEGTDLIREYKFDTVQDCIDKCNDYPGVCSGFRVWNEGTYDGMCMLRTGGMTDLTFVSGIDKDCYVASEPLTCAE